jgi:hypothetical protein
MDQVELLALRNPHWTPTQIHREVNGDRYPADVSLRTVQRVVTRIRGTDDSGPWSLGHGDAEDAALVLPVLRWTVEQGHPRPTQNVAAWVARIRRGFPDLEVETAYELAVAAAAGGVPAQRAETYLAFTPWRDDGAALVDAYGRDLVTFDVVFMAGLSAEAAVERERAIAAGETGPRDPVARLKAYAERKGTQS